VEMRSRWDLRGSWKGVSGDAEQVGLEGELERSEWRCGAGGT